MLEASSRAARHGRFGIGPFLLFVVCFALISLVGCSPPPSGPGQGPEVSSSPSEGSVEESATYRRVMDEKWATIQSMHPNTVRPETHVVRYLEDHEFWPTLAECMSEHGFPAEAVPGGGVRFGEIPVSQGEAQNIAFFVCEASYPMMDKYWADITEDQLRRLYEFHVTETVPCLEGLGLTVPPAPSLQKYLDTFYTEQHWDPFVEPMAGMVTLEEIDAVYGACPRTPEGWWD